MEILAWTVAGAFALLALFLATRSGSNPYPPAVARLTSDLETPGPLPAAKDGEPAEVADLREALRARERAAEEARAARAPEEDPGARAMRGLLRYADQAVLRPLESMLRGPGSTSVEVQDAVDALRDLAFYAESDGAGTEARRREAVQSVIQSVTGEFARETGTPVRFSGPDAAVSVSLAAERFKDALFLLLANAGHFGRGETVEVVVESRDDEVEIRIRDRGPGFSEEALKRAFEPFWTSESDALGLGLHRSREIVEAHGGELEVRNRDEGGAEAVVTLPRAR